MSWSVAYRLASLKASGLEDHSKGAITHNPLCGVVDCGAASAAGGGCGDDMSTHTGLPLHHPPFINLHTQHSRKLQTSRQQEEQRHRQHGRALKTVRQQMVCAGARFFDLLLRCTCIICNCYTCRRAAVAMYSLSARCAWHCLLWQ